ncbi:hypothetical protein [Paraliobacillus sediminis]|nr:hypothetical protein [Paraliobacillus sediminis]
MTTIVQSIGLKGMEGYPVQVEVQLIPGLNLLVLWAYQIRLSKSQKKE